MNGMGGGGGGEFCNLNTKNLIHLINIMFSVDYTRFTMRHYAKQQDLLRELCDKKKRAQEMKDSRLKPAYPEHTKKTRWVLPS